MPLHLGRARRSVARLLVSLFSFIVEKSREPERKSSARDGATRPTQLRKPKWDFPRQLFNWKVHGKNCWLAFAFDLLSDPPLCCYQWSELNRTMRESFYPAPN